jgi:threonine dehydrogenase-like Zn-dependent dehydrogenase
MIMGHEFCGTVVEVGSEVDGVRPGDRVAVEPMVFCGRCASCREGHPNLCHERRFFGVMDCNGSMAEYLNVPARLLFRMPAGMAPEIGAMVEPSAVALHATGRAGRIEGSTVLVVGAGPIGLLLVGMVKARRPRLLLVSDLSDQRLELARRMGADVTIQAGREEVVRVVGEHTGGRGADVSFEAVGAAASVE